MTTYESEYERSLRSKGWVQTGDGRWSRPPRRPVRPVEADRPEPGPVRPLDKDKAEHPGGEARLVLRVTMVALRRRLLDPDAVAMSCKPLTDAVAATLGYDDADPSVAWEWSQVRTDGEEGVLVKVEKL